MNLEAVYKEAGALLEGHFLLSSGNHSAFYLQSAIIAKIFDGDELHVV